MGHTGGVDVAVLVYDGVSGAEAVAPYEVFRRADGVATHLVAERTGPCVTQGRPGLLVADRALADLPAPDVLIVPGGLGAHRVAEQPELRAWVATAHRTSQWTAAVSTGSLLLGAAGVLDGVDATGHWLALDDLAGHGATPVAERLVVRGRIATASGSASAHDLALVVLDRCCGPDVAAAVRRSFAPGGGEGGGRRPFTRLGRWSHHGRYVVEDAVTTAHRRRRRGPRQSPSSSS